jgi:DNA replication protein DnaC
MPTYSELHWGMGDPDCPICHGVGYVRHNVPEDHPHFGKVFDCDCRQANATENRLTYLRKIGGLEFLSDKTFDTFSTTGMVEANQSILESAYNIALDYATNPEGWLLIMGNYGSGKTHLAAAIANHQLELGNRVLFVTAPDLLDHLRGSFAPDSEENYQDRFQEVKDVPLLILDDLGIESPTPWAMEKLYQVINHRYNAQLPLVITTNHSRDELEMRLRSRLSEVAMCKTITLNVPDYRRGMEGAVLDDLNDLSLFQNMTFDTFRERPDLPRDQRDNLQRAFQSAFEYAQEPSGWLVLLGEYGAGKTHIAAAIANHVRRQSKQVLFVTVPDLLDHLRATYAPNSHQSYDKRFNEIKTAQLLVLDDLGTESATPWAREKLYQLFNYRYTAQLPTVVTTAHALDDLDPRLVTRLRDKRLSRIFALLAPAYLGDRQANGPRK